MDWRIGNKQLLAVFGNALKIDSQNLHHIEYSYFCIKLEKTIKRFLSEYWFYWEKNKDLSEKLTDPKGGLLVILLAHISGLYNLSTTAETWMCWKHIPLEQPMSTKMLGGCQGSKINLTLKIQHTAVNYIVIVFIMTIYVLEMFP